jgi:hypothetical protein
MTTKTIPPEFKVATNTDNKDIKRAFFSDITSPNPYDCENCGGMGRMFVFIALQGPYNSPSSKLEEASHWSDDKWWIGHTHSALCPVCKGEGKKNGR